MLQGQTWWKCSPQAGACAHGSFLSLAGRLSWFLGGKAAFALKTALQPRDVNVSGSRGDHSITPWVLIHWCSWYCPPYLGMVSIPVTGDRLMCSHVSASACPCCGKPNWRSCGCFWFAAKVKHEQCMGSAEQYAWSSGTSTAEVKSSKESGTIQGISTDWSTLFSSLISCCSVLGLAAPGCLLSGWLAEGAWYFLLAARLHLSSASGKVTVVTLEHLLWL